MRTGFVGINRQQVNPIGVPRSVRQNPVQVVTSMQPGKMVPLAAFQLFREDQSAGNVNVTVEMQETYEILANRVSLRVMSYCVPWLAFERFERSRDQFDRSYMGQPQVEDGDVVPFVETHAMGAHGSKEIYKYLGEHAKTTDQVNTMYAEAYNLIWNFRAKNRSMLLPQRTRLDTSLAPAFWNHSRFQHVVPRFDQAQIDGEVPLNILNPELSLKNKSLSGALSDPNWAKTSLYRASDTTFSSVMGLTVDGSGVEAGKRVITTNANPGASPENMYMRQDLRNIVAELSNEGISVSLSNFELARKTQAFAKMRERFDGLPEEYLIDMLMSGLSIPELHLSQPMLIGDVTTHFSQMKRYATDADNLTESAVSGMASVNVSISTPRVPVGGIVMVVAEAVPEQLFERQQNPFFHLGSVAELPDFLRDELDPEKVEEVMNNQVDTDHDTPEGLFGFAPLHWKWATPGPKIGGKFYRPAVDLAEDDARRIFWAVENENPVLTEDFYIVNEIHVKPFYDKESDQFEARVDGGSLIQGNTRFGTILIETDDNYDKVWAAAPHDRIEDNDVTDEEEA